MSGGRATNECRVASGSGSPGPPRHRPGHVRPGTGAPGRMFGKPGLSGRTRRNHTVCRGGVFAGQRTRHLTGLPVRDGHRTGASNPRPRILRRRSVRGGEPPAPPGAGIVQRAGSAAESNSRRASAGSASRRRMTAGSISSRSSTNPAGNPPRMGEPSGTTAANTFTSWKVSSKPSSDSKSCCWRRVIPWPSTPQRRTTTATRPTGPCARCRSLYTTGRAKRAMGRRASRTVVWSANSQVQRMRQ